jgi:hypothetical protein
MNSLPDQSRDNTDDGSGAAAYQSPNQHDLGELEHRASEIAVSKIHYQERPPQDHRGGQT